MSHALLAIQNILQNSNIFNRSRERVLFTLFGDKKVTQFSGFLPTSVSYLKSYHKHYMNRSQAGVMTTDFFKRFELTVLVVNISISRKKICLPWFPGGHFLRGLITKS